MVATPRTKGRLISWAFGYDLLVKAFLFGRERSFRERILDLARLRAGDVMLDVGCGTGTLAIQAARRIGAGSVTGIDASGPMIARAISKAKRAGVSVDFREAIVEALPFADASFDVVTSTMMLHHLGRVGREECAREIKRVLKPGGRVLAVDFNNPGKKRGIIGHLHRHGHVDVRYLVELVENAGFTIVDRGGVGVRDLQFVLAVK